MKRHLAAIVALDVVGYSRLMAADEAGTLRRLNAIYSGILAPAVRAHGGRVVKIMGDGLIAEFTSAVEAVEAATGIQRKLALWNDKEQAGAPVALRIGVNLGDIIHEGADIFGDGVNIAARIEGIAEPGGVYVSGTVFEHVRNKAELDFENLGERTLKNIDRPIRVYRVVPGGGGHGSPTPAAVEPKPQGSQRPTIAVLAFQNMSGDAGQNYFSDGITEDLITELSRFRELAVISRNSSFAFKNSPTTLQDVGKRLGARYIVEGSVRKAADRIRITAQLIDSAKDRHIWAERYDRDLEDLFDVQDDVVRRVATALVDRLEYSDHRRAARLSDDQLKAYDHYLRGREHFFSWSMESNRKARAALSAALELEDRSAAALALYAEILFRDWLNGWSADPEDDLADAYRAAQQAEEIDPQDSRTQVALGMLHLFHRQYEKSKRHFGMAASANPNDMRVPIYASRYEVLAGSPERAVELCRAALELNPFGKYNWNLAIAHFGARNYRDAIVACESVRNPPEAVVALLAASHAMAGEQERARGVFARLLSVVPASPMMLRLSGAADWRGYFADRWPFRDPRELDHLIAALRLAGMPS